VILGCFGLATAPQGGREGTSFDWNLASSLASTPQGGRKGTPVQYTGLAPMQSCIVRACPCGRPDCLSQV